MFALLNSFRDIPSMFRTVADICQPRFFALLGALGFWQRKEPLGTELIAYIERIGERLKTPKFYRLLTRDRSHLIQS